MATAKLKMRTPLGELNWVKVTGEGKLKMGKSGADASDYVYTASIVLTDEYAESLEKQLNAYWLKVKPSNIGRQSYSLIKEEKAPVLDAQGNKQTNEYGETITAPTGRKLLTAKTNTVWPDGKTNSISIKDFARNTIDLEQTGEIGNGSTGVLIGAIGAQFNPSNPGLMFFLQGIQLKTLVPYVGSEPEMEDTGEALVIEGATKPSSSDVAGALEVDDELLF